MSTRSATLAAAAAGSMVDQAYLAIRERILDNHWAPGYRALEQALALELGMSRTPVREALIRLQNEGLIEVVPRHNHRHGRALRRQPFLLGLDPLGDVAAHAEHCQCAEGERDAEQQQIAAALPPREERASRNGGDLHGIDIARVKRW